MAERPENSVLFSLKELRKIEDDRISQEEQERRRREEEERLAREEAARRAQEAEEAARRAEQDAALRAQDEQTRTQREEQLRLQEAEARARVEAQARLEQERLRLEMEGAARGAPKWLIPAIVAVVLVAGGVLGYIFGVYIPAKDKAADDLKAKAAAELKVREEKAAAERAELLKKLEQQETRLQEQLKASKDAAEKEKLQAEIDKLKNEQDQAAASTPRKGGRRVYRPSTMRRPAMADTPPPKPMRPMTALDGLFGD